MVNELSLKRKDQLIFSKIFLKFSTVIATSADLIVQIATINSNTMAEQFRLGGNDGDAQNHDNTVAYIHCNSLIFKKYYI